MPNFDLISLVLAIIALIAVVFVLFSFRSLQKMRKVFFAGKEATTLEDFIMNQNKKINELIGRADYIEDSVKEIAAQQLLAVQKIGMLRYNPFKDDGGNLSFSMAFLDAKNNGVVITSMHGREQNRVYAKPIKDGSSEFQLTDEEKKAISTAKIIKDFKNN